MSLYSQLQEIRSQAIGIIKLRVMAQNGAIHYSDFESAWNGEELEDDFLSKSFEVNHYLGEFEGNTIMYPLSIYGNEHDLNLWAVDEFGSTHSVDIFELDADNICLIADSLIKNTFE